ncbi:hypothetical protein D3C72_1307520 [compost metagenome]
MGANRLDAPFVVEAVFQAGEGALGRAAPRGPFRARVQRTPPIGAAAVGIPERKAAPAAALRIIVLIVVADAHGGARAQVGVDHSVEHGLAVLVVVQEGMVVLVGGNNAPAHAAVGIERRGQVGGGAIGVPVAHARAQVGLELAAVGVLAHQIDGRRRVAGAGHQARGAAHDFHAVIDDRIDGRLARRVAHVERRGHPVVHVIRDAETARVEGIPLAVEVLHRDARRAGHDVGQRAHVFVVHALAGHDGDRLRRLAQR